MNETPLGPGRGPGGWDSAEARCPAAGFVLNLLLTSESYVPVARMQSLCPLSDRQGSTASSHESSAPQPGPPEFHRREGTGPDLMDSYRYVTGMQSSGFLFFSI